MTRDLCCGEHEKADTKGFPSIEVTPEMIEAGIAVHWDGDAAARELIAGQVALIYRSMQARLQMQGVEDRPKVPSKDGGTTVLFGASRFGLATSRDGPYQLAFVLEDHQCPDYELLCRLAAQSDILKLLKMGLKVCEADEGREGA
jgi:hypothetical protein